MARATWARIFAFGVENSILALAIGWESYILVYSNHQKMWMCQFSRPWIFILVNFCHFLWLKFTLIKDSTLWNCQNITFWEPGMSKNDFTEKSELQKISWISTVCYANFKKFFCESEDSKITTLLFLGDFKWFHVKNKHF